MYLVFELKEFSKEYELVPLVVVEYKYCLHIYWSTESVCYYHLWSTV